MGNIEWVQVIVAFILGVLASAVVKSTVSGLRSKIGG